MDHERLEEAIAGYALGALDDDERYAVERMLVEHMPGCESCRTLFADLREVAGDLALVASSRSVPAEVEARILGKIREERPPAVRPRVRPRLAARLGVAAALLAIAGLGAWNVQLGSRVDGVRRTADGVAAALGLMGAPDARSATLAGDRGTLVFVWRPGEAVLVGHDIDAPPSGRVLQLWLLREGVPTSVGVFRPDEGLVVVPVRVDPGGFDRVAVTVERGPSGVTRPSGAPVYAGLLTA